MAEPITLEPDVIEMIPVHIGEEKFACYPVGVMPYIDFLKKSRESKDDEAGVGMAVFELFESTMEPEEYVRFTGFAANPKNGISVRVMLELISALVERSASRPTEPSEPSSNGPGNTGDGSKDG